MVLDLFSLEDGLNSCLSIVCTISSIVTLGMGKHKRVTTLTDPQNLFQPPYTPIKAKTNRQKEYLNTLRYYDLTFGLGPAGTGKTFLAVSAGIEALYEGRVSKIIITRPAIDAGEKLGYLPGTFAEKLDPYLQPIYDAVEINLGRMGLGKLRKEGSLEIAPLAYMRGRTLSNAFILLDEAQNCTYSQILMFLTRLGEGSKCVVTGDTMQSDLRGSESGLQGMIDKLQNIQEIGIFQFDSSDVVRHPLVAKILQACSQ